MTFETDSKRDYKILVAFRSGRAFFCSGAHQASRGDARTGACGYLFGALPASFSLRRRSRPVSGRPARNRDTIGRAATTPAPRSRMAIRRCARRAASATRPASPGASPIRLPPADRPCARSSTRSCRASLRAVACRACAAPASSSRASARLNIRSNASAAITGPSRLRPIPRANPAPTACKAESRCRAWTYRRPGYGTMAARCYLKDSIKPPRHRPCCISGVVR